jgi:hypothetical protein
MGFSKFIRGLSFVSLFTGSLICLYTLAHQIYKHKEITSHENFYKNEEKIALDVLNPLWNEPKPEVNLNQERIKVLVIEGGGTKGLYALRVLDYIEKKSGKPISELYDVMGGTSVGSLIVSMLSVPENGKPKYSAEDLITIFPISAQETLQPRFKQKILSGYGLFTPLLNNQNFIKLLQSFYGDIPFSKALNHLVLFGYNYSTTKVVAFHNRGELLESADPLLYQLVGGTISLFGLFPPNKVLLSPLFSPQFIGDAGFVLNNPIQPIMIDLVGMYPGKKFLITYIVIAPKEFPDTLNFPFYYGSIKALNILHPLILTAQNQQIRESLKTLSSVYNFDLLLEIGLQQNKRWSNMNAFDFSNKKMQLIDAFAKLILQQNKEALDSVVEELLKD